MKKLFKFIYFLLIMSACIWIACVALEHTGYKKQVSNGLNTVITDIGSFARRIAGSISAQPSSSQSSASGSAATASASQSSKQPIPQMSTITAAPSENSGSGRSSAGTNTQWGETGMTGLKVYEYGKSLLSDTEKAYYDQMKSAIINVQTSVTIKSALKPAEMEKIYKYFDSDHPDLFYLKNTSVSYSYVGLGKFVVYQSYTFSFQYAYDKNTVENMRSRIDKAALEILARANGQSTDYRKELALHDAVVDKCDYNVKALENPDAYPNSFSIYGMLVSHTGVCEGYAKTMKLLLDSAGIPSLYITGEAASSGSVGPHAWNMADISGKWYYLDATFDDPVYMTANGQYVSYNKSDYTYFNFISKSDHVCGKFDSNNPFSGNSENYAVMPNVG